MCINVDNWLEVVSALGSVLISAAIAYFTYQIWKTTEKTRRSQQYQRYIDSYHKLVEAQSKAASHDYNKLQLALKELGEIRDEAQLCLSKEVVDCVQNIIDKVLEIDRLRAQEKSATNEAFKLEVELGYEQLWQIYRKSLKID